MPTQAQYAAFLAQSMTVITCENSPAQGERFPSSGDYRIIGAGRWSSDVIGRGISAIYVSSDAECIIYKTNNWNGESKILTGDNPILPDWWNDLTASLELRPKQGGAVAGDYPPAPALVNGQVTNQAQIDAWYAAHPGYRERQNGGNVVLPPPPANPYGLPPAAALGRRIDRRFEAAYTAGYDGVLREAGVLQARRYVPAPTYDVAAWQFFNLGRQDAATGVPRRWGHGPMLDGRVGEDNYWFELYPSVLGKGTTLDRVVLFNKLGQVGQWLETVAVRWQYLGDSPADYRAGHQLSGPRGAIRRLAEREYGNDLRRYGGPAFLGIQDRSGPRLLSPAVLDTLVPDWEEKLSRVVDRYDRNGRNGAVLPLLR